MYAAYSLHTAFMKVAKIEESSPRKYHPESTRFCSVTLKKDAFVSERLWEDTIRPYVRLYTNANTIPGTDIKYYMEFDGELQ